MLLLEGALVTEFLYALKHVSIEVVGFSYQYCDLLVDSVPLKQYHFLHQVLNMQLSIQKICHWFGPY